MTCEVKWALWGALGAFLVVICIAEDVGLGTSESVENVNLGEAVGGEEQEKLRGILNWAIENSDPEQLRKLAEGIERGEIDNENDEERRGHIQELIKLMSEQPSEVDLLKEAVLILNDHDASDEEQLRALTAVQILVEPIDNANDLKALGAIGVLVSFLEKGAPLDGQAAYAIGTAASNNPKFQADIAISNPEVFDQLIKLVSSQEADTASKALYALSALVRNSSDLRALFYTKGGLSALHKLLAKDDLALSLARKALGFLADILQLDQIQIQDEDLIRIIISKVEHDDLDIVEKAVRLLLLFQQSKESRAVIAQMDIGAELWRGKAKLQKLSSHDYDDQYVSDILGLIDGLLSSTNGTEVPTADIHEEL